MMDTGIHVGNKVEKETSESLKDIISTIFRVGKECDMDQSTIVEAIHMVQAATEVKQVTITGSCINGDKVVNIPNWNEQ